MAGSSTLGDKRVDRICFGAKLFAPDGVALVLIATVTVLVLWWSRREGWGAAHRLGLAGGALLTYAWIGFAMPPLDESPGSVDLIGNAVFAAGAIILLAAAIRNVRRMNEQA